MWSKTVSNWFVIVASLAQTALAAAPEPVIIRQQSFAIPFKVDRADDPARQAAELQLYVSTDRGAHWQLFAKTQPSRQHFLFKSGSDGEYWFAVRTIDRSGHAQPEVVAKPGLRVIVDTSAQPEAGKAEKPAVMPNSTATEDQKGSVAIAINPPIGRKIGVGDNGQAKVEFAPELPPGERPRMVNSQMFELEYDIDSIGPSGIGRVELWGTPDGGKTWRSFATDNDNLSPMVVSVAKEGVYGFRMVVTNGTGLGGKPPAAGDLPDLWVGVDLTKPTARITSAQQGVDSEAGTLIISWQADDRMLSSRPVSLSFSTGGSAPWLPVASGLENTGRYAWPVDSRTPAKFFLRLEVSDEAGNVSVAEQSEPVSIDQSRPTVRVKDIRPVSQTGARPSPHR